MRKRKQVFSTMIQVKLALTNLRLLSKAGQPVHRFHGGQSFHQWAILGEVTVEALDVNLECGDVFHEALLESDLRARQLIGTRECLQNQLLPVGPEDCLLIDFFLLHES